MLQVTEAVRAELLRRLPSEPLVRMTRDVDGVLHLDSGSLQEGDTVLLCDAQAAPVLVAPADLAEALDGAIVHFRERADDHWGGAGLTVLWPREGPARTEPSAPPTRARRGPPPWLGVRSVFRRRVTARSTTQIASP